MTHTLLLADDSATIQRVIELTFSGEDVNVLTVGDGEQAIARIPIEHPDIILADIGMPKRNGYDVAAFVKGHPDFKHIPVLLLAGAFEPVDQQRAEQVGCNGVLVKPFEPQLVIARVRELLDGAKGGPTQATADVARPVERLAPSRSIEISKREEPKASPVAEVAAQLPPEPVVDFGFRTTPLPDPLESVAQPLGADESLDDYFDRLDAAFATLDSASKPPQPAPRGVTPLEEPLNVPTLDDLLGLEFVKGPDPRHTAPQGVEPVREEGLTPAMAPVRSLVADAFTALLAVEQGEAGAAPVRLTAGTGDPIIITDALVDELTRRVVARLAPDAVRDIVSEIVSKVAERLVREEIERIRNKM